MTHQPLSIGPDGLKIIQDFESLRLDAYLCPAGKLTIGWGHVLLPRDYALFGVTMQRLADIINTNLAARQIVIRLRIMPAQAAELLRGDTRQTALFLNSVTRAPLKQHQFDALGSFVFNVGQGHYAQSTLRKKTRRRRFSRRGGGVSEMEIRHGQRRKGGSERLGRAPGTRTGALRTTIVTPERPPVLDAGAQTRAGPTTGGVDGRTPNAL